MQTIILYPTTTTMGINASRTFSEEVASCVRQGLSVESLLENPQVMADGTLVVPMKASDCASSSSRVTRLPAENFLPRHGRGYKTSLSIVPHMSGRLHLTDRSIAASKAWRRLCGLNRMTSESRPISNPSSGHGQIQHVSPADRYLREKVVRLPSYTSRCETSRNAASPTLIDYVSMPSPCTICVSPSTTVSRFDRAPKRDWSKRFPTHPRLARPRKRCQNGLSFT